MTISKPPYGSTGWNTATDAVIDEVNAHETALSLDRWHGAERADAVQHIGVPLYIFPDYGSTPSVWETIAATAPASRYVIANPNTGPGSSSDSFYVTQIQRMQASGVKVLGYVSTHYATVALATVLADAQQWVTWYGVDGIFLDETSYNSDHAHYLSVYQGVKAINDDLLVVANPGLGVIESMNDTADVFMSFEGTPTDYRLRPSVNAPAWERLAPASKQWHLIHSVASLAEAHEMLDLSRTYRAGTVFVTDRTMPNPWLGLPVIAGIWEAQISRTRPLVPLANRQSAAPVTVTYAASITFNAVLGCVHRVTATGNLTVADITGGIDGQVVALEVLASGGARTVTVSGSSEVVPSGQWWTRSFRYNATANAWFQP